MNYCKGEPGIKTRFELVDSQSSSMCKEFNIENIGKINQMPRITQLTLTDAFLHSFDYKNSV